MLHVFSSEVETNKDDKEEGREHLPEVCQPMGGMLIRAYLAPEFVEDNTQAIDPSP